MSPICFFLCPSLLLLVNSALSEEVTVLLGGTDTMHLDRPQDSSVLADAEVSHVKRQQAIFLSASTLIYHYQLAPPSLNGKWSTTLYLPSVRHKPLIFLDLSEQTGRFMPFQALKWHVSQIFTTVAVLWRCVISSVLVQTTVRNCLMMHGIVPKAAIYDNVE